MPGSQVEVPGTLAETMVLADLQITDYRTENNFQGQTSRKRDLS